MRICVSGLPRSMLQRRLLNYRHVSTNGVPHAIGVSQLQQGGGGWRGSPRRWSHHSQQHGRAWRSSSSSNNNNNSTELLDVSQRRNMDDLGVVIIMIIVISMESYHQQQPSSSFCCQQSRERERESGLIIDHYLAMAFAGLFCTHCFTYVCSCKTLVVALFFIQNSHTYSHNI